MSLKDRNKVGFNRIKNRNLLVNSGDRDLGVRFTKPSLNSLVLMVWERGCSLKTSTT